MKSITYCFIVLSTIIVHSATGFSQEAIVSSIQLDNSLSLDGLLVTPNGTLYGTEGYDGTRLYKIDMDGTTSVVANGLNGPIDMDYDESGDLFVSTFNDKGLYKITLSEPVEVDQLATVSTGPSGVVVNRATGDIYVSHYGAGFPGNGNSIYKVASDGTSSIFVQGNGLQVPVSLAIDEEGNLYAPNISNARLYKITPEGEISLFVQLPTAPLHPFNIGHIAYANDFLYVTGNSSQPLVFRVALDGTYEVIAGDGSVGYQDGNGSEAQFNAPNGIAASVTGDSLFISELNQPSLIRIIDLRGLISSSVGQSVFGGYVLAQNTPNPVRSATSIEFELPQSEQVTVSAYSIEGQLVDTLINERVAAGRHTINWDMHTLAPGTYIYRIHAGKFQAEKRAVKL